MFGYPKRTLWLPGHAFSDKCIKPNLAAALGNNGEILQFWPQA